ncbi:MAG TPA: NAD-binding protein [Planctomycetota bacterium]|nr:NAD-binding protein [Planctomycetota bacterium]
MKAILVGAGRPLYFLAQTFRRKDHAVTLIVRDAAESSWLANQSDATVVHGDGSNDRVLEDAGARSADLVLAATANDADNLIICQQARARFAVPRAVALVNDPDNQAIFAALGVDAISPSMTVASLVEQWATCDRVTHLVPAGNGKVTISEVTLGDSFAFAGRPIAELGFPRDALIAVVMRDAETLVPRGDTKLQRGDRVLLVALAESHGLALQLLTGGG